MASHSDDFLYRETVKIIESVNDWFKNSITYEVKKDGTLGSILKYDNLYAITFAWLVPRRGSVFTLLDQFCIIGGSTLLVTIISYLSCDIYQDPQYCLSLPPPSTSFLTLITLCSFVVAFFANSVLQRWWSVRMHIQSVMGAGIEILKILSSFISSEYNLEDLSQESKKKILKEAKYYIHRIKSFIIFAFHQIFNKARESNDIADLIARGVLLKSEQEFFHSLHTKGNNIYALLMATIHNTRSEKGFFKSVFSSESRIMALNNCVTSMRSNASSVSLYLDVQLPYPFIQIVTAVVYAFLIQLLLVCASFISAGIRLKNNADIATGYLTIILYNFVLLGLLRLYEVLSNPLGDDAADFPGYTYMKNFEKTLNDLTDQTFSQLENNGKLRPVVQGEVSIVSNNYNDDEYEVEGGDGSSSSDYVQIKIDDVEDNNSKNASKRKIVNETTNPLLRNDR